jgi:hypothetical protein
MGMKRLGSCDRDRSRDWRVESAKNNDAVKGRPVDSSRRVVLGEKESLPGIRGMVAKRMPSFV